MIHEILPVGRLQCNCSIFGDEASLEAIVVDPGDEIASILAVLAKHSLKVTAIVITHAHIDHIGGAAKLKAATGAPVWMNENDQPLYDGLDMQAAWLGLARAPDRTGIDAPLKDGVTLQAGDCRFHALHTPGHTQGSCCLWIPSEGKLVAGDTLFLDSVGRTDLPGGNHRQLLASIKDKLFPLPDATVVVPGHGPNTTVGREKEFNYFLQDL